MMIIGLLLMTCSKPNVQLILPKTSRVQIYRT